MDRNQSQEIKILRLARKIAAELDSGKSDRMLKDKQVKAVAALLARSPSHRAPATETTAR